jgi:molybdenum cofactor guanylyltransferase
VSASAIPRRRATGAATGIVLAGGRSTRFGRDKLMEPYRGVPLFHHVVLRLAEVCGDVVVVLGRDDDVRLPPGGARIARDAAPDAGPLAGLAAGLAATDATWAVAAGGDMPDVSTAVVRAMLRVAAEATADAVALVDAGERRPLPVVVRTARVRPIAAEMLRDGERSLRGMLDRVRFTAVDEATWRALDPRGGTLRDVDVPADLEG